MSAAPLRPPQTAQSGVLAPSRSHGVEAWSPLPCAGPARCAARLAAHSAAWWARWTDAAPSPPTRASKSSNEGRRRIALGYVAATRLRA